MNHAMTSLVSRRCLQSTHPISSVVHPSPTMHHRFRGLTDAAPFSQTRCEATTAAAAAAAVIVPRVGVHSTRFITRFPPFHLQRPAIHRCFSKYSRGTRISKYHIADGSDDHDRDGVSDDKTVLVLGSSGALGRQLVSHFSRDRNLIVIGADVADDPPEESLDDLNGYIALPSTSASLGDLSASLFRGVDRLQGEEGIFSDRGIDAIVCASGAWEGDIVEGASRGGGVMASPMDEEMARASGDVVDRMMRANFYPIVAASCVGHRFMADGGLFVTIGASAALSPTPGMIGYGSAKSAAHHYIQTLGAMTSTKQKVGTTPLHPGEMTAVGILPLTLDTPANRAGDPDGKHHTWVKPADISLEIGNWIEKPHLRPHSGSLVKVISNRRSDGSGGMALHLVR